MTNQLISKDRTTSVVDGSGVVHDPDGLDRAELVRLARKRAMIEHYDPSKLGPNGFKVSPHARCGPALPVFVPVPVLVHVTVCAVFRFVSICALCF